MKTEKNILIAFFLNLAFAVLEFLGGIVTGSVAIVSDAVHDLGDATSIGASYFFERKSKRQPDEAYTYGYARYSVIGGMLTTLILLFGSTLVILGAIEKIVTPTDIHYDGMIALAVVGIAVNFCAALITRRGGSLNQRAVNLHMLEDVLGWIVVLFGALVMKFTGFAIIDPLMSIGVAAFILVNAIKNLKEALEVFLEKTPHGIDPHEVRAHVLEVEGVLDVHHMHAWTIDGQRHYATMHLVISGDAHTIKEKVRAELAEHGIGHATLETETEGECCHDTVCRIEAKHATEHRHHHH